jgi:hypothetical protein
MTVDYYGNRGEGEGYPLAVWLWGHRLRHGQHWMEYLLEFLNVIVGFGYRLGQGLEGTDQETYARLRRMGLRRFVFYDEWEKNRDPRDDQARRLLQEALEPKGVRMNGDDPIVLARQLLRSYSAVEEQRSWYAKSLFPVHENLLFWEALRKRTGVRIRGRPDQPERTESLSANELDVGVTFGDRNFFARGGEVYYLMLSGGTQTDPERRNRITDKLRRLLTERNQEIGTLAALIDGTWTALRKNGQETDEVESDDEQSARLGWIPARACRLYTIIADDVGNLLSAELDPLESLDLLAHLICFHVIEYIYHRAHVGLDFSTCATGDCLETRRLCLLVDALEGRGDGVIRRISAALYKEQEQRQIRAARDYVQVQVQAWATHIKGDQLPSRLQEKAEAHFDVSRLHKGTLEHYEQEVKRVSTQFRKGRLDRQAYLRVYADLLTDLLLDAFRKHFIGVHRKLAQGIGLVAPRHGRHQRFVLGDTLLKALVLANVDGEMPYDDFLQRLYARYGLVIGRAEAQRAGLNARHSINTGYYDANREALLVKLKNAGLLHEYSDATAMVKAANA